MFGGLFLHEVGIVGLGKDSTIGEAVALFFRMAGGGAGIGEFVQAGREINVCLSSIDCWLHP